MQKNEELATMTAEKLQAYKEHLTVITNGLINLAKLYGSTVIDRLAERVGR